MTNTDAAPRPHFADVTDAEITEGIARVLTAFASPVLPMNPGHPEFRPSAGDRATWLRTAELFMDEQARRRAH